MVPELPRDSVLCVTGAWLVQMVQQTSYWRKGRGTVTDLSKGKRRVLW